MTSQLSVSENLPFVELRLMVQKSCQPVDMGVSKIGASQNGWFIMENPIEMDDLGVPLFSKTSTLRIGLNCS